MIYELSFIMVDFLSKPKSRVHIDKRNHKKYIYIEALKEWDSLQILEP